MRYFYSFLFGYCCSEIFLSLVFISFLAMKMGSEGSLVANGLTKNEAVEF